MKVVSFLAIVAMSFRFSQAFLNPAGGPCRHLSTTAITTMQRSLRMAASDDEFASYSSTKAFLFPGQGAQYVGMGSKICEELPAAKKLYDAASDILGYDLLARCTDGPKDILDSTEVSQPAIFVASAAAVEKLRAEKGEEEAMSASVAMGLSLGEYSALHYAGALSFEDGVKLTKARGEAMQKAADMEETTMVSVIGLDTEKVAALCEEACKRSNSKIQIANYLCPGNYAVSGSLAAAKVVEDIAKSEFGARMTVRLAVAGAFHTTYMAPAVDQLKDVLKDVTITTPRIPVVSIVDVRPHSNPDIIKEILTKQVTSPVKWEETMNSLINNGLEHAYELGPGKVCAGIIKRINKGLSVENIEV